MVRFRLRTAFSVVSLLLDTSSPLHMKVCRLAAMDLPLPHTPCTIPHSLMLVFVAGMI